MALSLRIIIASIDTLMYTVHISILYNSSTILYEYVLALVPPEQSFILSYFHTIYLFTML
jgi:hypothetical protein